jgi:hypothetical protein
MSVKNLSVPDVISQFHILYFQRLAEFKEGIQSKIGTDNTIDSKGDVFHQFFLLQVTVAG